MRKEIIVSHTYVEYFQFEINEKFQNKSKQPVNFQFIQYS
jgi:hypothetical protein